MRSLWWAAVAAVLVACEPAEQAVAPLYDAVPVEPRDIEVTVDAAGVIEPESTVEVKSKASGEVLAVHGETGDLIEIGHMLVEIDKRTPRNRLAEAEAALKAAIARRQIAETQMRRAERLFESQTLTQADFEQTQLEFANAESQVVSTQVAVENARITLEDTDVRAPVTGTIIEKAVEPGIVITSPTQAVSGGTVLMKMADLTSVQVRTRVDETDIGKIRPGMKTRVTVAAYPNQPFEGEVLKVEPQAILEQNVTMFAVLIKISNRAGLLKPGMNADVQIEIASRHGVPAIPTAALRAASDVPVTAKMLNMDEEQLRQQLWPQGASPGADAANRARGLAAREAELPAGADRGQIMALTEKRRGGDVNVTDYQFGGNYWVVAVRNGELVPVAVSAGLTDLEHTEIVAGLEGDERVLLLPSTSLFEQQERLQQFIAERFGSSTPFQQQRQPRLR